MSQGRRIVIWGQGGAVGLGDGVAVRAAEAGQELAPGVELGCSLHSAQVALSARRLQVLRRQNGLLPRLRNAVCGLYCGCFALAAMTDHASELAEGVRNRRMRSKRLLADASQGHFLEPQVASGAAVGDALLRDPDLMNATLESLVQSSRVGTGSNQLKKLPLILAPRAKEVFCRSDGQRQSQDQAGTGKTPRRISENDLPQLSDLLAEAHVNSLSRLNSS